MRGCYDTRGELMRLVSKFFASLFPILRDSLLPSLLSLSSSLPFPPFHLPSFLYLLPVSYSISLLPILLPLHLSPLHSLPPFLPSFSFPLPPFFLFPSSSHSISILNPSFPLPYTLSIIKSKEHRETVCTNRRKYAINLTSSSRGHINKFVTERVK